MKTFRIIRIVLLLIAVSIVAYRGYTRSSSGNVRIAPSGEKMINRPVDDPQLEAAAKTARAQWPNFVEQLNKHDAALEFSIKIPLPTKDGSSEHIWMSVSSIDGETIHGNLANEPFNDIGYKNGDPLSVQANTIEDWIITKNGELASGGFSLEILKNTK